MQIQDLLKQGRMGCAECYETFEVMVKDILRNVQKSPSHIGKTPRKFIRSADVKRRITEREKALAQAISEERYEDCVILRDEIRKLKEVLSAHDND
jgi:protein arginine kinase activator